MHCLTSLLAPIRVCEAFTPLFAFSSRPTALLLGPHLLPVLQHSSSQRKPFVTTPVSRNPCPRSSTKMSTEHQQSKAAFDTRPVIISGPSGAGKSTILKRLFAEFPDRFGFSVSHTTRAPRPGEQDGREYHFTTREHFVSMIADNQFVENAIFGGNRYGTSFAAVADVAANGRVCILDIELEGVKQVDCLSKEGRLPFVRPKFLFLAPPSVEVLEQRLRGRGTDTEEAIQKRLNQARVEMEFAKTGAIHERVVVNDDLDQAYKEVRDFII